MKFSIALFAILSTTAVQAAPMTTCSEQAVCLDFTMTEVSDGPCSGDCDFLICMTVNQDKTGCDKSGGISHTCTKPSGCVTQTDGFLGLTATEGIDDGFTSCQTVSAGATAEFLMKDGNGACESGSTALTDAPGDISGTAACQGLEDVYGEGYSCTGNKYKECIWQVAAPATCSTDPPIAISSDPEDDAGYLCS
jgi:hypothetical protein